jgi:hypothetical protein
MKSPAQRAPSLLLPVAVRHRYLLTSLTPAKCYESLRSRVRPGLFEFTLWPTSAPRGEVTPTGFIIRKGTALSRGFDLEAQGDFVKTSQGTAIEVCLSLDGYTRGFMALWFTMVCFFLALGILGQFGVAAEDSPSVAFVLIPGSMLVFGYLFFTLGSLWAASRDDELIEFLKTHLQAEEAER